MGKGVPAWLIAVGAVVALGAIGEGLQKNFQRREAVQCVKSAETYEQAQNCVYGVN
jgi:hypothetical protein